MKNKIIKIISLFIIIFFISACTNKMELVNVKTEIYKKRASLNNFRNDYWNSYENKAYRKKLKKIQLNAYNIEFTNIKPYLIYGGDGNVHYQIIGFSPHISWARGQGFINRSKYRDKYSGMIFTLNKEPFNKKLKSFYNHINKTYENKLNSEFKRKKNINKFVNYNCDKNIIFSKYERDENYNPLKATCYAKRLDKDVFLITRFAHPNTQDDTKLFKNEIMPTMLKSIKVTPTKLSPWKYY